MLEIKTHVNIKVREIVAKNLPGREVNVNYQHDSSTRPYANRWIQVKTAFPNIKTIHYEYTNGKWELHIEPQNDQDGYKYARIARYLWEKTNDTPKLKWDNDGTRYLAIYQVEVCTEEQLPEGLLFLCGIFDKLLTECSSRFKPTDLSLPYKIKSELKILDDEKGVSLISMNLKDLFDLKLAIPDYQRIYCWQDKNILTLWSDLNEMPNNTYHLGTIILHRNNDNYDIIDGQQRLVTLTIIMRALGYDGNLPLLLQRFKSAEACDNISNAKYVINEIKGWDIENNETLKKKILQHLSFSVLVLNTTNLDLAYTFFSNQNSRGVRLSDYDILKAHHLRFLITNERQSEHLARRWNSISQEYETNGDSLIHKTLGLYLFRLRKWMRKQSCDATESDRPIKDEFSAAPLIPGIPPFGERFYFYEKIQGGSHFFAYTDYFVDLYKQFIKTPQVYMLREYLLGESHWKYESVIETVLFAYFSKFGKQYLSEALFCIASVIAQHRYVGRALQYKINEHVQNVELVMMIDQASSPSFFLAETLPIIKISGKDLEGGDIKVRFYNALCRIFRDLNNPNILTNEENLRMARFTDVFIESKKIAEYE